MKPEITYKIICEAEDIPYTGNCSAVDEETDRETEEWIASELERGNRWAWCYVLVEAHCEGYRGADGLGGCSYESQEAFERDGYYGEMQAAARADLLDKLRDLANPTPDAKAADLLKRLGEEP